MIVDQRFFPEAKSVSVSKILDLGICLLHKGDPKFIVQNVGQIKEARPNMLIFAVRKELIASLELSKGYALITTSEIIKEFGKNILSGAGVIFISKNPKFAFAQICSLMFSSEANKSVIHPTAQIDESANIANDVSIGPFCYVAAGVTIGKGSVLGIGVCCKSSIMIGENCHIEDYVTIERAIIEDNVSIGQHTVIGKEGFGFEANEDDIQRFPHLGRVLIGKKSSIGANCCIDRGTLQDTIINELVLIDNLVHIAHNVEIGKKTIILAQVGIAGSSIIKENCIIGGQAGIADHTEIPSNTTILSRSGVTKSIETPGVYAGFPAKISTNFWREQVILRQLAKNNKKNRFK